MSVGVDPIPLPAPPLQPRRWIPVLVLTVVTVGVVAGGYLLSDVVGKVAGEPITVSASVQITPLAGWELAQRFGDPRGIRLTSGSTSLDVVTIPFTGSDVDLLSSYVSDILEPGAEQFRVSEEIEPVRLASGLTGARIAYVGLFGDVQAPIEGEVTAVVSPSGVGVVFDGWAPAGQLQFEIDEIDRMIEDAEIT